MAFDVDQNTAKPAFGIEHEVFRASCQCGTDPGFLEAGGRARVEAEIGGWIGSYGIETKQSRVVQYRPEGGSIVLRREVTKNALIALHRTAGRREQGQFL